jgi:hypothetical protein
MSVSRGRKDALPRVLINMTRQSASSWLVGVDHRPANPLRLSDVRWQRDEKAVAVMRQRLNCIRVAARRSFITG